MLDSFFLQILNMSFTASVVILFVMLARLLLKKAPKVFSYALWGVVLFRLVCPFSFESVISLLPTQTNPIQNDIIYAQVPQINTGIPIVNDSVNALLPAATPYASMNPIQGWIVIGSALWLMGVVLLLVYSVMTLIELKIRLKNSVHQSGNIYLVEHLQSPFVMGLLRPKIYLPTALTAAQQRYILLHEQTHIKRCDHMIKLISFFVLCLHWFNPLVWVAFFLCGRDMELSCDESVVKQLGADVKKEYSSSLLTLATGRRIVGGTPLAFGEGDTKSRIKNVLNYKAPAFWVIAASIVAVVAIGVGLTANPKNNPILIPKSSEVTSIGIEQINEGESLGMVEIDNKSEIETILKALQNTDKTMQESVNDSPKRDEYFQINVNGSNSKRFYLYNDREQYFIEEPYIGIYKTSRETSVSIAEIYTATPSDYKPAIMINDQIYWLSTDANPAAPAGNTWLFGQIKKVSPPSAPPSENFEAIGLDSSYVGKDFYISSDGNTLYLNSMAGEKTLQFVFEEVQTETTEPVAAEYSMMKLGKNGEVLSSYSLKSQGLAEAILMSVLVKSSAWEGVDVNTLDEYYLIRQTFAESGEIHDYYAYLLAEGTSFFPSGTPVLQGGPNGRYSAISSDLYLQLVDSFDSNEYFFFWLKPDEAPQYIGNTAAEVWLKSFMDERTPAENRISDYEITDVTVISGEPKKGINWEDMAYHYVVGVTYNITAATEQYRSAVDGVSGKGSFQGLFRELCVKVKAGDGGGFQIVAVGTGGGEQEFAN